MTDRLVDIEDALRQGDVFGTDTLWLIQEVKRLRRLEQRLIEADASEHDSEAGPCVGCWAGELLAKAARQVSA